MKKRIKSIALMVLMIFSVSISSPVSAATVDNKVKAEMTIEEAIKIVEDNYLNVEVDGTFKIDPSAKDVIPEEIYNSLENGVNGTNEQINENKLEVSNEAEGYSVKPVGDFVNSTGYSNISARAYNPPIISNHTFFWWGYIAEMNNSATNIFINELEWLIYAYGSTGAVAAYFTVGASVVLAAAGGVAAYTLVTQAKNALEITPDGSTIYAYGSPSRGQVYKVTQLYG